MLLSRSIDNITTSLDDSGGGETDGGRRAAFARTRGRGERLRYRGGGVSSVQKTARLAEISEGFQTFDVERRCFLDNVGSG